MFSDNVCLAIIERERKTTAFWRPMRAERAVLDEGREYLAFVHLDACADHPVQSLPYGSQRLVEIAIALCDQASCFDPR